MLTARERPERVDCSRPIYAGRTAGIGASSSLPPVPAIVRFLNPQLTFRVAGGNHSSCPKLPFISDFTAQLTLPAGYRLVMPITGLSEASHAASEPPRDTGCAGSDGPCFQAAASMQHGLPAIMTLICVISWCAVS